MASPKSIKSALAVFVEVHGQGGETTLDAEYIDALRQHFGDGSAVEPTDDELAEATFGVLSDVPEYREPLKALAEGPAPESFSVATTAVVMGAVIFALKTHIRFKRSPNGKWELLIEKKPTTDKLLTDLISKLLGKLRVLDKDSDKEEGGGQ